MAEVVSVIVKDILSNKNVGSNFNQHVMESIDKSLKITLVLACPVGFHTIDKLLNT